MTCTHGTIQDVANHIFHVLLIDPSTLHIHNATWAQFENHIQMILKS